MRKFIITISMLFLSQLFVMADEGMWIVSLINKNYAEMQKLGLKLTPEDIYDVNNSSLKDAIVQFGGGCTGEVISDQGLIMTNMHCGYSYIQGHTTVENDYLKDGFWAKNKANEIVTPGLKVQFLISMKDVTNEVLEGVTKEMDGETRYKQIETNKGSIESQAVVGNHYKAEVKAFFAGNQYFLLLYEVFKDVRYVGSPPVSISDFGSLTDNWMWPRHKADFSLFRVYMSPDGKPAEYSPDNVPYEPKHVLPISLKGYKKGDYAMIMGYPGTTTRYITSYGVRHAVEVENPNRIKIRGKKLEIINQSMERDHELRIKYASKYKRSSNYWKYSIGQNEMIRRMKTIAEKEAFEKQFTDWLQADKKLNDTYGNVLSEIKNVYDQTRELKHTQQYLLESLIFGPEIFYFAYKNSQLYNSLEQNPKNKEWLESIRTDLVKKAETYFKDFDLETDKAITKAMLKYVFEDVDPKYYPPELLKYKENIDKTVDKLYEKSAFGSLEKFLSFTEIGKASTKKFDKDPAFKLIKSVFEVYFKIGNQIKEYNFKLQAAERSYMAAIKLMKKDKWLYPDANFTMRVSYGTVGDYQPADGVYYNYFTTLKGVMEKEDPNNYEFIVPEKLKELYQANDYGEYGENGVMKVCFTTNNDMTGGNSGSPLINGNGEIIGLAFDGNWEGMNSDITFSDVYQKTIGTDIRYILFLIDKFAGAKHLVDEMKIVK